MLNDAVVNFGTERVTIDFDPETVTPAEMADIVKKAGYQLILPADEGNAGDDEEQKARAQELMSQKRFFIVGLIFTLPLFFLSMGRDFFPFR